MTSMASRLSALEKSHKKMRLELVQKDKELLKMKRKCQLLMKENESLQHSSHAEATVDDTDVVTGDETKSSYEGKKIQAPLHTNQICHHCRWRQHHRT